LQNSKSQDSRLVTETCSLQDRDESRNLWDRDSQKWVSRPRPSHKTQPLLFIANMCILVLMIRLWLIDLLFHMTHPTNRNNRLQKSSTNCQCCDRKARVASAQSFTLWQQATIEFTRHDHSMIACSRLICILLFFSHIPFVVNHTINATPTERLQHQLTSEQMKIQWH